MGKINQYKIYNKLLLAMEHELRIKFQSGNQKYVVKCTKTCQQLWCGTELIYEDQRFASNSSFPADALSIICRNNGEIMNDYFDQIFN